MGVTGYDDFFVPWPGDGQYHGVDPAGSTVDPKKGVVSPVELGRQVLGSLDAAVRLMEIVQFGHQRQIEGKGVTSEEMLQPGMSIPLPWLVARGV